MAYLKGGSIVDGNLYVEGGLRVKRITDSSGTPLPHLFSGDSSVKNALVKFMDGEAAIHRTAIMEDFTNEGTVGIPVYSIITSLKSSEGQKLNKVQIHMDDSSMMEFELKGGDDAGLYVSIYPGQGEPSKQFVLKPSALIIPYSASEISVVDSTLIGVDASGNPVGEGVVPDHFAY